MTIKATVTDSMYDYQQQGLNETYILVKTETLQPNFKQVILFISQFMLQKGY